MQVNPPRHLRAITIGLLLAAVACSSESKVNYNIPDQPDGLTILPANATVEAGYQPLALTLELRQNGNVTFVPASSATWASDAPAVATVDKTGALTGVSKGTANVSATYAVPGGTSYTAKKAIAVTPAVKTVEFSFAGSDGYSSGFVVDSGHPQTVTAVAIYDDHTARDITTDTTFAVQGYAVTDTPTATVAGNVLSTNTTVAAPGELKNRLVGTYHGHTYTVPFTTLAGVKPTAGDLAALDIISASPKNDADFTALTVSVPVKTKFKVYSQASYTNTDTKDDLPGDTLTGVAYASSDKTVLTVSGNTVTAVAPGTATVTAEYVEGTIKKTAKPLKVTVTAATMTHLFITTATNVAPPGKATPPFNGVATATVPAASFVFASEATPATGNFIMPLDSGYSVKAIALYSDNVYREVSRSVTWKLANTNAADDKAGVVHADLTAGSSALIGTVTPPANDPAQYTPGDVTLTASFTQADGSTVKVALPITVKDLAVTLPALATDSSSGVEVMTVKLSYPGSGLGGNAVTAYDASARCVYETADEAIVQVDNVPNGLNQTTVYQVPPSTGQANVTAWFLPTENSAANSWKAGQAVNVGTIPAP